MTNLFIRTNPVTPFNIEIFEDDTLLHQEICFLSDMADRILILDEEYRVDNNYIQGLQNYIEQIIELFPDLNLQVFETN
jgi:hypothetical protein